MPEISHKPILDRNEAEKLIKEHFSSQIVLLKELANYGSNLVVRAYNSSNKNLGDAIVCGVLLKQVVTMVDAVETLLASGAVQAAHLPSRAAYEASLYLGWMLVSDYEKKARYFYVSNLRQERLWSLRGIKGSSDNQSFSVALDQLGEDIFSLNPSLATVSESHLAEVNRILFQPELASIDQEFELMKKRSKGREPKWHKPFGVNTVRQIAKEMHRLPEYELSYARGSEVVHTGSYKDHICISNGRLVFKSVRHLEGISDILNFSISSTLRCYEMVLKYYRPAEFKSFASRYLEEWREPFLSIKKIEYKRTA